MSIDTEPDRSHWSTIGEPVDAPDHVVEVRRRAGLAVALGAGCVADRDRLPGPRGRRRGSARLGAVRGPRRRSGRSTSPRCSTPARRCWSPTTSGPAAARAAPGWAAVGRPPGGRAPAARGWWRDGLLVVRPHYVQRVLEDLDPRRTRVARLEPPAARRAARGAAGPRHPRRRRRTRPDHGAARAGRRADSRRGGPGQCAVVEDRPRRGRAEHGDRGRGPGRHGVAAPQRPPRAVCATAGRRSALLSRPGRRPAVDRRRRRRGTRDRAGARARRQRDPRAGRATAVAARADVRHEARVELDPSGEETPGLGRPG